LLLFVHKKKTYSSCFREYQEASRMIDPPAGQGFAAGIAIATPASRKPVERLAIGDEVLDAAGNARRVVWVGRIMLSAAYLADHPHMRPIRVAADALGECLPRRDLVVAPQTELGVVMPNGEVATVAAHLLVNEINIVRLPAERDAELFEVELEGGGGVIAEQLPAGLVMADHGSPAQLIAMVRARAWVSSRAGCLPGPLLGRVDSAVHGLFYGWALDEVRPWRRVALEIVVNGRVHTATLAMHRREDLVRAGMGDGSCGFHFEPMPPLPADRALLVQVRRVEDGVDLPGSPVLLASGGGPGEVLAGLHPAGPTQSAELRAALRGGIDRLQARRG
jgi:hypothetical protein